MRKYKEVSCADAREVGAKVRDFLSKAIERSGSDSADGALARGSIYQAACFYDLAVQSFTHALAVDPCAHEAAARMALTQLRMDQPAAALETAVRLAAAAPDYAMEEITTDGRVGSLSILGLALLANGRRQEARRAFENARNNEPSDNVAWVYLAQAEAAEGAVAPIEDGAERGRLNPRFAALGALLGSAGKGRGALSGAAVGALVRPGLMAVVGRPMVVAGEPQVATLVEGDDWCSTLPPRAAG